MIRNRKDNEADDIKEDIDDTKTVGGDTLRSRQMTPKKNMEIKDAESIRSFGMVSAQIDKAIAENENSVLSMGNSLPVNPQELNA